MREDDGSRRRAVWANKADSERAVAETVQTAAAAFSTPGAPGRLSTPLRMRAQVAVFASACLSVKVTIPEEPS